MSLLVVCVLQLICRSRSGTASCSIATCLFVLRSVLMSFPFPFSPFLKKTLVSFFSSVSVSLLSLSFYLPRLQLTIIISLSLQHPLDEASIMDLNVSVTLTRDDSIPAPTLHLSTFPTPSALPNCYLSPHGLARPAASSPSTPSALLPSASGELQRHWP